MFIFNEFIKCYIPNVSLFFHFVLWHRRNPNLQQKMHLLSNFVHLLICSLCPAAISYHCSTIKPESASNFQQAQQSAPVVVCHSGCITTQYHPIPCNSIQNNSDSIPSYTAIQNNEIPPRSRSLTYIWQAQFFTAGPVANIRHSGCALVLASKGKTLCWKIWTISVRLFPTIKSNVHQFHRYWKYRWSSHIFSWFDCKQLHSVWW